MLKEEQAAELLRRCEEEIVRRPLPALRGRLRSAGERAAAVWEMIALEASAQLGRVEYEDPAGGPDLRLWTSQERFLWIEVSYLYPRFENEDRRRREVDKWVQSEKNRIEFSGSVQCRFFGTHDNRAGPVLSLPLLHERRVFLKDAEVHGFFEKLRAPIIESFSINLTRWSICLTARPEASPFSVSSGPLMEAPRIVGEHAAYRKLLTKSKQHNVDAPQILCIGSDTSFAIRQNSSSGFIDLDRAVRAAMRTSRSISAVITVQIAGIFEASGEWRRMAQANVYPAEDGSTRFPLTKQEIELLNAFNFNRWRYAHALDRNDSTVPVYMQRVDNRLRVRPFMDDGLVKLCIPGPELQDALAGRKGILQDDCQSVHSDGQYLSHLLGSGWRIAGCRLIEGEVTRGLSELVEITLAPYERVYSQLDS